MNPEKAPGWRERFEELMALDDSDRTIDDLEALGVAAYMIGRDEESSDAWSAAHERQLAAGDDAGAARSAFWCAFGYVVRGQMAHASAWFGRASSAAGDLDCAAKGLLLIPAALQSIDGGDPSTAVEFAVEAESIGRRHDDPDLVAFAVLAQGQGFLAQGRVSEGMTRLDDVMLQVTSGRVGPIASGIAYCAVVLECMDAFDLARATEWTEALDAWCRQQPDLAPYRGQCLIHQAQLQQAAGEWVAATTTVRSARTRLSDPPHPALGLACYQEGELHRLAGDLDAAEEAYGRAAEFGHSAMPGLALLELHRGNVARAAGGIRRALAEDVHRLGRAPVLAAAADIFVTAGHLDEARTAAAELEDVADEAGVPYLQALSRQTLGAVAIADGDAAAALTHLRAASAKWRELRMPFETARTAILTGIACHDLGDEATAELEFDHARQQLEALGAEHELTRIPQPASGSRDLPGGLTAREIEVLAQVARGRTNREIAAELTISQHTVGRHLENIFAKLGVSSRAAATSFAHRHGLV